MRKKISIISAVAIGSGIGKDNKLLCHLPADLKRFKELTKGHTVIMGRKTFESLPNGPLPERVNIVLTRNPKKVFNGVDALDYYETDSLESALELCLDKAFIIGGAEVYREALKVADKMHITWINKLFLADTFFPDINHFEWDLVSFEHHEPDEKNPYPYSFFEYERVKD